MADPKQLKFQFTVDEASLQKTRQLVRELTTDLTKLNAEVAKVAGGGALFGGGGLNVSGGGAARQSPEQQRVISRSSPVARPLVQSFLDQKQVFKGMADGSKDSMRIMTDALKRAVSEQRTEVQRLQASLESLTSTYDRMGGAANKAYGAKMQNKAMEIQGRINQGRNRLGQLEGMLPNERPLLDDIDDPRWDRGGAQYGPHRQSRWQSFKNWAGFGPPNPPGPNGQASPQPPGWFGARPMSPGMMTALRMGGLAMAGVDGAIDQGLSGVTGLAGMGARRADIVHGQMARLLGGDVKMLYAMRNLDSTGRQDLLDRVGGTSAKADMYRNSVSNSVANVPVIGKLASALGLAGGGKGNNGGLGGAWSTAEQQSYLGEGAMQQIEAESKRLVMENFAMDRFQNSLHGRISAGRNLGLGRNKDPRTGQWVDSYARAEDRLQAQGYSVSAQEQAKLTLQSMAGERYGATHAHAVMRAQAQGLGGYASLLAAGGRAGIGEDFARASIGGGIDQTAGIHLGSSIIGSGFDPRGTTTGLGVLAAAQYGFGWNGSPSDFNNAERVKLGMGLGDSLTTGGLDPYQKGRNLVGAIRNNPGLSIYGQDYLANGMSFKQQMDIASGNSAMTTTGDALGLTPEMIRKQLRGSVSSVVDRFKDDPTRNDPMTQTIRALRKSGGDIGDFLGGMGADERAAAKRNLGAFFGIQTGQGEEAGIGAISLFDGLAGATTGGVKRGNVGRSFGQTETDMAKNMAEASKQVTGTLEQMADRLNESIKDIPTAFTKFKTFNDNLSASTEIFIRSLSDLTVAIKGATSDLGGGWKAGGKR